MPTATAVEARPRLMWSATAASGVSRDLPPQWPRGIYQTRYPLTGPPRGQPRVAFQIAPSSVEMVGADVSSRFWMGGWGCPLPLWGGGLRDKKGGLGLVCIGPRPLAVPQVAAPEALAT